MSAFIFDVKILPVKHTETCLVLTCRRNKFFFSFLHLCLISSHLHVFVLNHSLRELHTFWNCRDRSWQQLALDPPTGCLPSASFFQFQLSCFSANSNHSSADERCRCQTNIPSTCSYPHAKIPHDSTCAYSCTGTETFSDFCLRIGAFKFCCFPFSSSCYCEGEKYETAAFVEAILKTFDLFNLLNVNFECVL